jgi:uncharacterized repeat protein (TIGR03803 family)
MPSSAKRHQGFVLGFVFVLALPFVCDGAIALGAEESLYSFKGGSDGAVPFASLTSDNTGNLYGTTAGGGGSGCEGGDGCGTVFKLAPGGKETVLYSFQGGNDGAYPRGGLIADNAGNFYGTTGEGGGGNCGGGCGTVFKVAPDATETILYAFQGAADGVGPVGNLIADASGDLFGVTYGGGSFGGSDCADEGCGTVFEVMANGAKKTLYTFLGRSDGWQPRAGLQMDNAGNLYGTTSGGGSAPNCPNGSDGCGTVFEVAPDGTETILHAFQGASDGAAPISNLIADSAGNLYGTTAGGGSCSLGFLGCGTVFKLAPDGTETVLYALRGGDTDGWAPEAGVVMDKKGNLYGTTYYGGSTSCGGSGCGVVFEVLPNGKETVLERFKAKQGRNPSAGLLLGKKDILYGTTTTGGKHNDGVVFSVTTK